MLPAVNRTARTETLLMSQGTAENEPVRQESDVDVFIPQPVAAKPSVRNESDTDATVTSARLEVEYAPLRNRTDEKTETVAEN